MSGIAIGRDKGIGFFRLVTRHFFKRKKRGSVDLLISKQDYWVFREPIKWIASTTKEMSELLSLFLNSDAIRITWNMTVEPHTINRNWWDTHGRSGEKRSDRMLDDHEYQFGAGLMWNLPKVGEWGILEHPEFFWISSVIRAFRTVDDISALRKFFKITKVWGGCSVNSCFGTFRPVDRYIRQR